jgi:hypothetical protein
MAKEFVQMSETSEHIRHRGFRIRKDEKCVDSVGLEDSRGCDECKESLESE